MAQQTAVVFGVVLLIGGREASRLCQKEQAQQRHHGEVFPRPSCHFCYSIYPSGMKPGWMGEIGVQTGSSRSPG